MGPSKVGSARGIQSGKRVVTGSVRSARGRFFQIKDVKEPPSSGSGGHDTTPDKPVNDGRKLRK